LDLLLGFGELALHGLHFALQERDAVDKVSTHVVEALWSRGRQTLRRGRNSRGRQTRRRGRNCWQEDWSVRAEASRTAHHWRPRVLHGTTQREARRWPRRRNHVLEVDSFVVPGDGCAKVDAQRALALTRVAGGLLRLGEKADGAELIGSIGGFVAVVPWIRRPPAGCHFARPCAGAAACEAVAPSVALHLFGFVPLVIE